MRKGFIKAALLAAAVLPGQAVPSHAQGFLQQLFGLGNASPSPQSAPSAGQLTPGGRPYAMPGPSSPFMSRRPNSGDEDDNDQKSSGQYRTICVRTCDGFYFPISNHVSKKGLYRDGMKCRAQCGEDARVFYLPAKTTDVDGAVDLQGRQYGRMNTAYAYRKTLVAGCQCKPDPWSETELARHQRYADVELDRKLASLPKPTVVADAVAADGAKTTDEAQAPDVPTLAEPTPAAKPKPNTWRTTTARATPKVQAPNVQAAQRPAAKQASAPSALFSGGMGLGGGQLTWPGDAPRRP